MHATDSKCWFCKKGTFLHRGEWKWTLCPCGEDYRCEKCWGSGIVGTLISPEAPSTSAFDEPKMPD